MTLRFYCKYVIHSKKGIEYLPVGFIIKDFERHMDLVYFLDVDPARGGDRMSHLNNTGELRGLIFGLGGLLSKYDADMLIELLGKNCPIKLMAEPCDSKVDTRGDVVKGIEFKLTYENINTGKLEEYVLNFEDEEEFEVLYGRR